MTTDSMEDLLVEGLRELYYSERQLVDALGTLADQTEDEAARQAFSEHREETQEHVDRLEWIFDELGEDAEETTDSIVEALIDEHEQFAGENDGDVLDRYNIIAGQKTEHYEIAAYGNVTSMAGKLGYEEVAERLEQTLREEQHALDELSEVGEQFDRRIAAD